MVAPVTGSMVACRGGFRPGQSPPGGCGAPPCCIFLSACIIQTGVCWPTAADFHSFATLPSIPIGDGYQAGALEIVPTGVGVQSGAPNFSLPSIPIGDGCQSGTLELVPTGVGGSVCGTLVEG